MTLSLNERGRQDTHRILSRFVLERVPLATDILEQVVADIEDDLLTFEIQDSSSPLFEKVVTAHLMKYGLLPGDDEATVPATGDGQPRLFGAASAATPDDRVRAALSRPAPRKAASAPQTPAEDGEEADDVGEGMARLFEPAPTREPELPLTENALTVLQKRYLRKDEEGVCVETPYEMFVRVAENIAKAEQRFDPSAPVRKVAREFLDAMTELRFLPNSPTLMNAGRELQQLSACFVLPVEDSMESIFETIKNAALIQKSGGGTGFSFSRLRPANDRVRSTKGVSSGPVSFMKAFDAATETVKQGGTRRGANMAILRVDHPDILDFVACKRDTSVLNNFNISVGLTEEFMEAVEADAEYSLVNPRSGETVRRLSARKVFDTIVNLAWLNGEPGMVFLDRINRDNPTPTLGIMEATNPCGEQPLLPYESCNLGSLNLARMVKVSRGKATVDLKLLAATTAVAVRFLDDVIEQNRYPLPAIDERTKANRKIGLGVMGWADLLIRLGIPYDSDEALELADKVMGTIHKEARAASEKLASERGAFPSFPESTYGRDGARPLRNATTTTVAPTGTISIIANCSSGIEPLFAVSYIRRVLDGAELVETNPLFVEVARQRGFYSDDLMRRVAESGSVAGVEGVPDDVREVFKTAADITPQWHVRMQAAFQRHVDNAVSKTVNFPSTATRDDIREVYLEAYRLGCKGCTVYRDGSRDQQVLSVKKAEAPSSEGAAEPAPFQHRSQKGVRPTTLLGYTHKIRTSEGKFYLTVNEVDGRPFEIFSTPNSRSREASVNAEALCRLVSLALRHGIPPVFIHDQLEKVRTQSLLSLPYNLARVLAPYIKGDEAGEDDEDGELLPSAAPARLTADSGLCPECGTAVEHEGGCMVCRGCGFSKCA